MVICEFDDRISETYIDTNTIQGLITSQKLLYILPLSKNHLSSKNFKSCLFPLSDSLYNSRQDFLSLFKNNIFNISVIPQFPTLLINSFSKVLAGLRGREHNVD